MEETITLLSIVTEIAPLILALLILAGIIFFALWVSLKVIVPSLSQTAKMFAAIRESWEELLERQEKVNKRLITALEEDLIGLKKEMETLQEENVQKDKKISALETKVANLQEDNAQKQRIIETLKDKLEKVESERDKLAERVQALEKHQNGQKEEKTK